MGSTCQNLKEDLFVGGFVGFFFFFFSFIVLPHHNFTMKTTEFKFQSYAVFLDVLDY